MIEVACFADFNLDMIGKRIEKLPNELKKKTRKALYNIGWLLKKEATMLINTKPKHGRTYNVVIHKKDRLGGTRRIWRKHVASAPLEPPAVITGTLRKAIGFKVHDYSRMSFFVRGSAPYARYLEYKDMLNMKGQASKRMAPRPFLSQAFRILRTRMEQIIREDISDEIKKIK